MLLKKIQPTPELLQAIREQDVEYIVEITQELCKDGRVYEKYVDIPKHFDVPQDLVEKTAIRQMIMNGKLGAIYTKQFPPLQCETDFRLINEDVDCSDMSYVLEPVQTNELILQKIDKILEYHKILANIDNFQRTLAVVKNTFQGAAALGDCRRFVVGSLFLNIDFYRSFLEGVCAYTLDYQVFDSRFEKFARFLVVNSQRKYNQDYFSRCGEFRKQLISIAQEEDKLRFIRSINTGQAEVMALGIELFIEANQQTFESFSDDFLQVVQRFKAIKIELSDCYVLNGILVLAQVFGLHQVINQSSFKYTEAETVLIDDKILVFKAIEQDHAKQQFGLFSKVPAPEELLDAYRNHDVVRIHAVIRNQITGVSFSGFSRYAQIPRYMNIPESVVLDAAVYGMIAQGKAGLLYQNQLPPLPCETDFRLMYEVSTAQMEFYFQACETISDFEGKIKRIFEIHQMEQVQYQYGGTLAEFAEVQRTCQQMDARDLVFGSKFLDFRCYKLFLRSVSGYNDDLHWYDPNYEMFAQFLRVFNEKSYNQDYFSRCAKLLDRIKYTFQSEVDQMRILNTLNCGRRELMQYAAALYIEQNGYWEKLALPFVENIRAFLDLGPGSFSPAEKLIFIVDLNNLLFGENLANLCYSYTQIDAFALTQCSPNEHSLLTDFRKSEAADGAHALFKEIVLSNMGTPDELLVVLLASGDRKINKFGVQFYAYRAIENIALLLIDELYKNDVLKHFLREIVATKRKSIFEDEFEANSFIDIYGSKSQLFMPLVRKIEHQIDFLPDTMDPCETPEQLKGVVWRVLNGIEAEDVYQLLAILFENIRELESTAVLSLYGFDYLFEQKEKLSRDLQRIVAFFRSCGVDPQFEDVFIGQNLVFESLVAIMCQFKDILLFLLLNLAGYYTSNIALIELFERRQCFDSHKYLQSIILLEQSENQIDEYDHLLELTSNVHALCKFLTTLCEEEEIFIRLEFFHTASLMKSESEETKNMALLYFALLLQTCIKHFNPSTKLIEQLAEQAGFVYAGTNSDEFTLLLVEHLIENNNLTGFLSELRIQMPWFTEEEATRINISIHNVAALIMQELPVLSQPIQTLRFYNSKKLLETELAAFQYACEVSKGAQKYACLFEIEDNPIQTRVPMESEAEVIKYAYLEQNNINSEALQEFKSAILLRDFQPQNKDAFCTLFYEVFETSKDFIEQILATTSQRLQKQYGVQLVSLETCYDSHAVLFLLQILIETPDVRNLFPIGSIIFSAHWDQISAFVQSCPEKISNWYLDYLQHLNIEHAEDFIQKAADYVMQVIDIARLQLDFDKTLQSIFVLYEALGFSKEEASRFIVGFCANAKTLDKLLVAVFRQSGRNFVYMEQIVDHLADLQQLLTFAEAKDLRLDYKGQRLDLPTDIELHIKDINNDPRLSDFAECFSSNPTVLFQLLETAEVGFLGNKEIIREMSRELLQFNNQLFCLPFELLRIMFTALLLQHPDVLEYIIDVWLMFLPNQEMYTALKGGAVLFTLNEAMQIKASIPEQAASVDKNEFYQVYHGYRSVIELYKRIAQNSMLLNRKLQLLSIGVNSEPILTSLQYILLQLAISDTERHCKLFEFTDVAKKLRDDEELEFSQVFVILVQCLLSASQQKTLLSYLIQDEYLNMKELLVEHAMDFVSRLGKIQLDDAQKTPNFWLHLMWQNIADIASAEYTSVLSSRFEAYSSSMDRQFALKRVENTYDCFKQEECVNDAMYKLLAFGYYDYDEQIDLLTSVLCVNETVFKMIVSTLKNEQIARLAKESGNQQRFIDEVVRHGYLVDYLREVQENSDFFEQALDVGHVFCSQDEIGQLIASKLCANYDNQSFESSSMYTEGFIDERVVHEAEVTSSDDDICSIELQDLEQQQPAVQITSNKSGEELNISQILSNTTAAVSVRPDVIHTQMLEKLTEFSDSDDAAANRQLFLTSDYLQKIEDRIPEETQIIYKYELADQETLQNSFVADARQIAVVFEAASYRMQYSDAYFGSSVDDNEAVILIEEKSKPVSNIQHEEAPAQPISLLKTLPTAHVKASKISVFGLAQLERAYQQTAPIEPDFDAAKAESFFDYSESDEFTSEYEHLVDPFSHSKFAASSLDVQEYENCFYQSYITSLALETRLANGTAFAALAEMLALKRLLLSYADTIFSCQSLQNSIRQLSHDSQVVNPKWSIFELLDMPLNNEFLFNRIRELYQKHISTLKPSKISKLCKLDAFRTVHTTEYARRSTIVLIVNALRCVFVHIDECAFCQKILTKCTACGRILAEKFDITTALENKAVGCKRCMRLVCKTCQCVNCE